MHLYETHIPVTDTKNSETFYREVVGLPFAYRDPSRDIVFLWVDDKQKGMLGVPPQLGKFLGREQNRLWREVIWAKDEEFLPTLDDGNKALGESRNGEKC